MSPAHPERARPDAHVIVPGLVAAGGLAYAARAWGYGLGSVSSPGPGLLPFVAGLALAVTGAWLAGRALLHPDGPSPPSALVSGPDDPAAVTAEERSSRLHLPATLAVTAVVFVLVLWQTQVIGLLPAAAVAVAVTSYLMRVNVPGALLTGVGFFAASYLIFERWLQVPMPRFYF